ncbi:CDP-diacylglycerol--glycerol-3-phosphate 3-phosphatidyltransferase [Ruminococcaceae bacterium OttesenSCG-928-O06]|nr:CDP-diacylglycerol--glycerol-3-phosphate 3-phosphatidyltransferase [Ruminococcaceae bacterium OttesenSCG-928-O06]
MNLPNKLTVLRILLIPVFIVFVSLPQLPAGHLLAGIVFSIASFTDYLDGHIARKRAIVTDFGKFADPLADKMLTTVAFLYMMQDGVCHPLVLVAILAREFAVSGLRMVASAAPGGAVIAANIWGKVKTVVQMLTIIFYYAASGIMRLYYTGIQPLHAYGAWLYTFTNVLCWVVAAITLVSGVQYLWANRRFIDTTK